MYSYEGTGRSLSHKLLKTLREKSSCNTGAGVELTIKRIIDKVKGKEHSGIASLGMYIHTSLFTTLVKKQIMSVEIRIILN